ncbi:xanthine dehydrogenase family protein molybdopterin-binding subunit [Jiangella sp. DSM 45060]|uniref:xanthine dehydrogenase family protein molybdopterin-binding subunit n=1 Tax=Jiangella sp. DSM 45060 TaxID=1798224 RepID=UPI00087C7871|nr:xanthine dehydrogenase family protein molybdopterin-binding subunit [Jiangella sp. DSM 45060]SDT66963.1 CO or xanthine dehydrogenase, Mo-binding subunit [Jiangella sp. DSM 45060]
MGETVVGRSVRRPDLLEKVTGAAEYCVDVTMPGMAHAKVVRSDRAHARITGIDVAAALKSPGVVAVVTADDLSALFARFGHIISDHWILATGKVRYYGEPVAVVVAETVAAAADAVELVRVSYEDLPSVMDVDAALAEGAPLVHERSYDATGDESFKNLSHVDEEADDSEPALSNLAHEVSIGWGDVDAAFAEAAVVVENTVHFPMLYAYAMEPYNAVASYHEGALTVVSTAQHPYMVRDDLARVFDLPLSRVRVTSPYLGGGYGSKSYTKVEPLASVASWATGRPVKLTLSVEEAIYTTRVDSARVRVKSGFAADGTILAREFDIVMDSGAYADNGPLVMAKSVNRCFGPYRIPNLRVRGRSVYTNTSPASSYRGFGAPQGNLAGETNLDQAAERLGISGADIRRRNLARKGETILPGKRGIDADIPADLEMVVESLERDRKDVAHYGIGFGCSVSDAGAYPISTAQVRIQTDGSVLVLSGSTEMGQGSRSLLAQVAAEELGVDLAVVTVVQSDTSVTPYERTTGASRTTTLVGLALQRACADARSRLRDMAAELFSCAPEDVSDLPGAVAGPDGRELDFGAVVRQWFGGSAGEVTGVGLLRRDGATQQMPPFWEVGMVGVAVEIDPETGVVAVDQLVTVADVGFAINPRAVEGQDLGAATQGLGIALHEELVYDGAQLANANVVDYRVPRVQDLPRKIDLMIAERRDGVGPYGAKGAGEGTLNPIGGAVAAAVARATGRWPDRLPLTPERVWRLINGRSQS